MAHDISGLRHRKPVPRIWSEIQGGWHVAWIADQLFGKDEIAGQRIENVLPRADGIRIAQDNFPSFRDCSHNVEPGCAVIAAVEGGALDAERLDSYRRLQREDRFLQSRHDESARLERVRQAKQGAKAIRLQNKLRNR